MTNRKFEKIYLEYYPKIKKYVKHFLVDKKEIEDVTQDTFVSLYRKKDSIDETSLLTYLYLTAKNYCLDSNKRVRSFELIEDLFPVEYTEEIEDLAYKEIKRPYQIVLIEESLNELSPKLKEVVLLRTYGVRAIDNIEEPLQKCTAYEEIANTLDITPTIARQRYVRACVAIQTHIFK